MTSSPCLGSDLALDASGCITAQTVNTAHGAMTYDGSGRPLLPTSAAWPYACPISSGNGLMKDPALGLWTEQQAVPVSGGWSFQTNGSPVAMAANAFADNSGVQFLTIENALCMPLQLVLSATMRAQITLTHGSFAMMTAWMGRASDQPSAQPGYYPIYKTVHFDDTSPGSVPFVLRATLTKRIAVPASGSVSVIANQWVYYNFYNAPSYSKYPGSSPYPTGSASGPTGSVNGWSVEWSAIGWPDTAPYSDGQDHPLNGGNPPVQVIGGPVPGFGG